MTNLANKFSYEDFLALTGGDIKRAYEMLGGFVPQLLDTYSKTIMVRTCPVCHKPMHFIVLKENPKGYTGIWSCTDEVGEPDQWCGYEELITTPIDEELKKYGAAADPNEPLIDVERLDKGNETLREIHLAAIYQHVPYKSSFPAPLQHWTRRRCPKCGTPMVFYKASGDTNVTGVFACPAGWNVTEDPAGWCGYEDIVTTPLDKLFEEYHNRSPDKQTAATELLLKECPRCGGYLVPRPVEVNDKGWKTRWICQRGFTKDDPEQLCGYEELSTETIGSYINAVNKIIAESK